MISALPEPPVPGDYYPRVGDHRSQITVNNRAYRVQEIAVRTAGGAHVQDAGAWSRRVYRLHVERLSAYQPPRPERA